MGPDAAAQQNNRTTRRKLQLSVADRRGILSTLDVILVNAAILLGLLIWTLVDGRIPFDWSFIQSQIVWFLALTPLWLILASANELYDNHELHAIGYTFTAMLKIEGQLGALYLAVFFLAPPASLPRLFFLYFLGILMVLILLSRLAVGVIVGLGVSPRRIVVIGDDDGAQAIINAISGYGGPNYDLVHLSGIPHAGRMSAVGSEAVSTTDNLADILRDHDVHELVLAPDLPGDQRIVQQITACYEHSIAVTPALDIYEDLTKMFPVEHLADIWQMFSSPGNVSTFGTLYGRAKRLMDMTIAAIGLVLFGLVLPFIALAIWLDSRGDVFFTQERVGQHGRVFTLYKLRSMIPDAEKDTGPMWSPDDDMRVTRVGRFLRRTRLDEFPQLWNVLRGDMSLIGPRPERPYFVQDLEQHIPYYRLRLSVPPGLTGWAQVKYDYGNTEQDALEKLKFDLYYIRHASLRLDGVIVVKTLGQLIRMRGK